jgi:CNT family concentrative nucleoside transporter
MHALAGMAGLLALAWAMSENRRAIPWRAVAAGMVLLFILAVVFLKIAFVKSLFLKLNDVLLILERATQAGTSLVFGYLGGGPAPFQVSDVNSNFVLAFRALPIVLVMSVLTTLLFYWRILPPLVRGFSRLLERTLGIGGAVGIATAANIFVGMVEAPLFIRPYLARLSRSELFVVMTGGMAGIAGTVFVVYATILRPLIPDVAGHLLVASVLGAPAAILISLIMVPECKGVTKDDALEELEPVAESTMDAIVKGTAVGLELLLNIVAMLIVLVALVHLANAVLGLLPDVGGPITLQRVLGFAMAPICWLLGVPWTEALTAGALMGIKTILNEFVAYVEMAKLPPDALSPRSKLIMLYALCGFANLGSLGIMIGGLATVAPTRRADIVELGPRSIVSGTLATCLLGAVVGVLS